MDPLDFKIELSAFDLNLLPIDREILESNQELLREAIRTYFTEYFNKIGGEAHISVDRKYAVIKWIPAAASDPERLFEYTLSLLKQGAYKQAEPILEQLSNRFPENADIHFNYGMMLSDQGLLEGAIGHLSEAIRLSPKHANAWNALGIAHHRKGNTQEAITALEESFKLDPQNPYTLRNLGGILAKQDPARGLPYLLKAVELMPQDQSMLYGYALSLRDVGRENEADDFFGRAIAVSPHTEISELCREERGKIGHKNFRAAAPGGPRMDAVMYCLSALQTFAEHGPSQRQSITYEIAMLGRNGLDINDPSAKSTH